MIALVAGATGLVGGQLIRQLAEDRRYSAVRAIVRRRLPPALDLDRVRAVVVDYERLADQERDLAADHVFCALGTTIRHAGSREAFRRVDLDYPAAVARLARRAGARHFSIVTAVGARPDSRIFYNRTKGEVEFAVRHLGYPSGAIFRPSMIGGEREDRRPLERLGQRVAALLPGRYRLVPAEQLARAMIRVAADEAPGWRVVESEQIRALGRRS